MYSGRVFWGFGFWRIVPVFGRRCDVSCEASAKAFVRVTANDFDIYREHMDFFHLLAYVVWLCSHRCDNIYTVWRDPHKQNSLWEQLVYCSCKIRKNFPQLPMASETFANTRFDISFKEFVKMNARGYFKIRKDKY